MALKAKLTNAGYLYIGANTLCGPPDDTLIEFSLNPGSFRAGTVVAMVAHDVSMTTITTTARDPNAVITLSPDIFDPFYEDNDLNMPGWQVALPYYRNTFRWFVQSKDGFNTAIESLAVFRSPVSDDASLSALSLSGITISPAFSDSTTSYTASAASSASSTTVTAITSHAND